MKRILILILKSLVIIFITMSCAALMVKVAPPPQGTGFENLKFMLLPFYAGVFCAAMYLAIAVFSLRYEKNAFLIALAIAVFYTVILFLV